MKSGTLTVLLLMVVAAWPQGSATNRRDIYLLEDDLVYARFLALARDGTYRQINRDARGRHASCRALRPRALQSGPLSVVITGPDGIDALPRLAASLRGLLDRYADGVFDAGTLAEVNAPNVPAVRIDEGSVTFDRADAAALAVRATETLESERTGDYRLISVPRSSPPPFTLPGNVFQGSDLTGVRQIYGVAAPAAPPFYFARIDAAKFAAEVGLLQPLHLPGNPP